MCHEKLYLSKKISQTSPAVPAREEELEIVDTEYEDDNDDSDVTVDSVTDSDE